MSFRKRISRHLPVGARAVTLATVITLLLVAVASALAVGNVDGVWGIPDAKPGIHEEGATCDAWATGPGDFPTASSESDPAIQTPPDNDENQVRYGEVGENCGPIGDRSGFGFDGNNDVGDLAPQTPFYLGQFTHYNNPLLNFPNPLNYVDLTVKVPVTCNDNSTVTPELVYRFNLEETFNQEPCKYEGDTICPDRVTVDSVPSTTFVCEGTEYTLQILGFVPDPPNGNCLEQVFPGEDSTKTEFITEERTDNVACLWGKIIAPGQIIVDKVTNPPGANHVFDFGVTGPNDYTQAFSLTDTQDPKKLIIAEAGSYTVEEVFDLGEEGWTLSSLVCTRNGQTTGNVDLTNRKVTVDVALGEITTCIFTNTAGPTALEMSSLGATCSAGVATVSWETVSEVNNQGFNVYRSTAVDGAREQVNAALIPSKVPGSTTGAAYQFVDSTAVTGNTYYYWVESVDLGGATALSGPVGAACLDPTAVTLSEFSSQSANAGSAAAASLPLVAVPVTAGLAMAAAFVAQRRKR